MIESAAATDNGGSGIATRQIDLPATRSHQAQAPDPIGIRQNVVPDANIGRRMVSCAADTGHSWNTRKAPRRFALLAGFVMVGAWAKASTKFGFATKQAARQPLKRAKARPMSE